MSEPIMREGTLCFSTAFSRVIVLDAATGRERRAYDSGIDLTADYAGGLVFEAGPAGDNEWCAFDVRNRKLLWQERLPAGDQATPMTCRVSGKQ